MKRNLNHKQYELNSQEQEQLWQEIRRETTGTHRPSSSRPGSNRRSFRPALAATAVLASVTLMVVWHLGNRQLATSPVDNRIEVAGLEHESISPPQAKRAPTVSKTEPTTSQVAPVFGQATPPAAALSGRIMDKSTGEALAHAVVTIIGTQISTITDSLGHFHFAERPLGQEIELSVRMLSYDPVNLTLASSAVGAMEQDIQLEPVIVATLQAFDVEGSDYMVEVKSAVTDHTVSSSTFEKYSVDSVDQALSKTAGVVMRAGEIYVRGGRSGQVTMRADGVPVAPPASVTGGTTPPNGEKVELMYFGSAGVNPFVATEDDALSTFALDVDNASWTIARNYLSRGTMPPKDAIRVEEFVNSFDARWAHHTDQPFRIHTDGARSRFGKGYHLLRIGLVGQDIGASERKPANLIFVIDISGSMARESRLGLVKKALHILLNELGEGDRVGIVVYGSTGQVRLPLTDISQREKIAATIDGLYPNGATNAVAGLSLAYKMARDNYDAGIINRVILCSDGVANTGPSTEAGGILDIVRKASDEGITLSTIGFGMGNYNDVLMEKLADQGDGNYHYVDKLAEAQRVFHENLTGLLQTIAREVKVQVEFDPQFVQRWRLLGYENRDVADEDFRDDTVDAGEVGAGHQVTALYELKLIQPRISIADVEDDWTVSSTSPAIKVGTVRLRHEAPAHDVERAGKVAEMEQAILVNQFQGDFSAGSIGMRVQTVVAEFAEILRGSYWAKGSPMGELLPMAEALAKELPSDQQVQDLAEMIRQAAVILEVEAAQD